MHRAYLLSRRLRAGLLLVLCCALALVACGSDTSNGSAALVVGVTSDFRAGTDLKRLDVLMTVDGQVVSEQSLSLGVSAGLVNFPAEFAFEGLELGAHIAVTLSGYDPGDVLQVVRHVEANVVADERRLIRVHLQRQCTLNPDPGGSVPPAPSCNETTETCISGTCQSAQVPDAQQETYTPDWASDVGDACKPQGAGPPEVVVGQGQSDYLAVDDYALAQVEAGPQGGHHVWVAARIKNLRQSGSITEVGGEIPSIGLSISALKVVFTLDVDEGGWCKLHGLRFQLDVDGNDVNQTLGQELKLVVTVTDSSGAVGTGERWFTLSNDII